MATLTTNYKLKKPAETDFVNVQDLNDNADIIDTTLKAKADLTGGKVPKAQLPDGLGILPRIDVICASGATVKVVNGSTTLSKTGTGTVSFDIPNYGTWTVTVTQGSMNKSITVEVDAVKIYTLWASLSEISWDQIAAASEAGLAEAMMSVGDEKDIVVDSETLTLVILGFNHDELTSGGKAGITFGLKNLMTNTQPMNLSETSVGGFTGSWLYGWLQNTLFPKLPPDLQAVTKTVNKRTSAGNGVSTIGTNAMKLFLFAENEVFGTTYYSAPGEGEQYPYFATQEKRIKYLSNGSGSASDWWERSPNALGGHDAYGFGYVYRDGTLTVNNYGISDPAGVCFGFCV